MRAEETPNDVFATGGSYKKPKNGSQRTLPVSYDVFGRESEPVRQSSPLDFASKISTCYKQQKVINVHVSSLDHYTVENSNRNTGLSAATSFIIDLVNDVIPQQSQRFSDCLSSATEAGKQLACDKTEDCLLVDQIYLGIFRLACNSNETGGSAEAQKLSVHVACVGNQCTLRGFYNHDDADIIEDISFEQIEKIICGPLQNDSSQAFLALCVNANLLLNCLNVGPTGMLCPTLAQNSYGSAKYVVILLSSLSLEQFIRRMKMVPSVAKKKDLEDWLDHRSVWCKADIEEYLFAHHTRKEHTIEELRWRAQLEVLNRKKRGALNRVKKKRGAVNTSTAVDPEDSLTHAMYPIEPGVLDAITIFKGDLKKLAPEEYLNDNLIDLKIKHLAATQLTAAQVAAIHVFNCMFYTCLTTPKSPEQGHKVVSRWTNKVDLFAKDYIIIPINQNYHWSLAVIIRPGAIPLAQLLADVKQEGRGESSSAENMDVALEKECVVHNRTCIIHMDSLGMHNTAAVGKALRSYLQFEWEARKKAELDAELDLLLTSGAKKDMNAVDVKQMKMALHQRQLELFDDIHVTKIEVPKQTNNYDCGLFVTKFAELVLRTQPSSTDADIQSKFANILRNDAFSQADIDGERKNMLTMIEGIRKNWMNLRSGENTVHCINTAVSGVHHQTVNAQAVPSIGGGNIGSSEFDTVGITHNVPVIPPNIAYEQTTNSQSATYVFPCPCPANESTARTKGNDKIRKRNVSVVSTTETKNQSHGQEKRRK